MKQCFVASIPKKDITIGCFTTYKKAEVGAKSYLKNLVWGTKKPIFQRLNSGKYTHYEKFKIGQSQYLVIRKTFINPSFTTLKYPANISNISARYS